MGGWVAATVILRITAIKKLNFVLIIWIGRTNWADCKSQLKTILIQFKSKFGSRLIQSHMLITQPHRHVKHLSH